MRVFALIFAVLFSITSLNADCAVPSGMLLSCSSSSSSTSTSSSSSYDSKFATSMLIIGLGIGIGLGIAYLVVQVFNQESSISQIPSRTWQTVERGLSWLPGVFAAGSRPVEINEALWNMTLSSFKW